MQHNNRIITAGNGGTKSTQSAFTIFYNQGTQRYDLEQTLQPDGQMWIDVGQLIPEHVPDKNGKLLPPDLTYGSYEFRDLTNTGVGSLFEGKVIYDKTYGHVAYGCAECCGFSTSVPWYDPIGVPIYTAVADGVNALNSCTNIFEDESSSFYNNWSSANTAIATVNNYGTHTGVAQGSTTSKTQGSLLSPSLKVCPLLARFPTGGVNVGPYKVEPISTTIQGAAQCPTGMQGWSRTVRNQLQYVNGAGYRISGITMADIISIGSTNQLGISGAQTGSFPTDSNGSWPDTYFVCSPACPTFGQTDSLQTWTFNQIPLAHSDSLVYKCASITVDGL